MSDINFEFLSIKDEGDDLEWLEHWQKVWPHCSKWYLSEGLLRRPSYSTCLSAIRSFMPEIESIYSRVVEKTGGSDLAARFLSLYNPPPYLAGCSQAIWNQDDLFLLKNYDYGLDMFEKTLFYSNWLKPVIGILDCAWGVLDGINSSGLVASLTFGGKKEIGEGFGAPLILRYLLETSSTVEEAKLRIAHIPCHMSYNITLLDSSGDYTKVYLCPGQAAVFNHDPISTNHQLQIDWLEYAEFSRTIERYNFLKKTIANKEITSDQLVSSFFSKPIFNTDFDHQFGTLYTSKYNPVQRSLTLLWQEQSIVQSFNQFNNLRTNVSIRGDFS